MSKSSVFEGDQGMVAKATELKNGLRKMVKAIVDEEDINSDAIHRTKQILGALQELKLKKSIPLKLEHTVAVPEEFLCPISKKLMMDPVVISTGQTYDRPFIETFLNTGNRICPKTKQVISHTILIPNYLIREMISYWCKNRGFEFPESSYYNDLTKADHDHFITLMENMSGKLSDQSAAAQDLRNLTTSVPSFQALFSKYPNAIPQLLIPFTERPMNTIFTSVGDDLMATLSNISVHGDNKKLIAEEPMVIPLLIHALRTGTVRTNSKAAAAAALFSLSSLDSNKELIGKYGALKPLIDLLDCGHELVLKDVAFAIFSLCIDDENKVRAVRDGAVRVILKRMVGNMLVDELLSILAMLSSVQKAVEEMGELEAVPCLLGIIRGDASDRSKENGIAILHAICFSNPSKWNEIWNEECTYCTISRLAHNGTSKAKVMASGILEMLNMADNPTLNV